VTALPDAVRIAMWSGPRNISTAMMRSFGNRPDTAVIDEPFYAAYLAATGIDHPMRAETLASQQQDWRDVVPALLGKVPDGRSIYYQKHMTHHMLPGFGRAWMAQCRNAFLIRAPAAVLLSYRACRDTVTLEDIGVVQQSELFDAVCDRLGALPPVVDSADILADPPGALNALCKALNIAFSPAMLNWPVGPRATDGAWAPAWYSAVERSTGFAQAAPAATEADLDATLRRLAEAARPFYDRMAKHRICHAPAVGGSVSG
jgi:hypothetical protein